MIIISYLYIYLLCILKQLLKSEKDWFTYLICVFTCQEQFAVNLTELHRHNRERAGAILHWKQQQSDW